MAACGDNRILIGDCIEQMATLEAGSVQTCVTSPPFWGLRDYGHPGQIGLEASPSQYVEKLVAVFRSVRRLLRDDGTLWLNLGDTYAGYHGNSRVPDDQAPSNKPGYVENMRTSCVGVEGLKAKDLVGIPWSVAFALRADGWYLRSEVVWQKTNPMPETARDRPARGIRPPPGAPVRSSWRHRAARWCPPDRPSVSHDRLESISITEMNPGLAHVEHRQLEGADLLDLSPLDTVGEDLVDHVGHSSILLPRQVLDAFQAAFLENQGGSLHA